MGKLLSLIVNLNMNFNYKYNNLYAQGLSFGAGVKSREFLLLLI